MGWHHTCPLRGSARAVPVRERREPRTTGVTGRRLADRNAIGKPNGAPLRARWLWLAGSVWDWVGTDGDI